MTPEQLRRERINRGYSRRALAREIDVPEQTLRRLEKGLGVTPLYAKRVADFFEVQVTDLLGDREPDEAAA
jgi:DNA-binding XRE family transcriptional regulator